MKTGDEMARVFPEFPDALANTMRIAERCHVDLASTEKWKGDQEEFIKREEDAVRQARAKLQQSRNTRDYGAANREVENKRKSVSEREDEVVRIDRNVGLVELAEGALRVFHDGSALQNSGRLAPLRRSTRRRPEQSRAKQPERAGYASV